MAISYTLCNVESFLKRDKHYAKHQTVLAGTEELPDSHYEISDLSFTEISKQDRTYTISKYSAYQDVRQNKHGRQFGQFFHWYLEPHEFPLYYIDELGLMIFATGRDTVDAFLRQMENDKESGLRCKRIEVDFRYAQPLLPIINGAWFADLQKKKQYLKSAALFGYNVDKSEEFKAAAEAGVISSLSLPYHFKGRDIQIGITRNGSVVFYGRIKNPVSKEPDIAEELALVLDVFTKYLFQKKVSTL